MAGENSGCSSKTQKQNCQVIQHFTPEYTPKSSGQGSHLYTELTAAFRQQPDVEAIPCLQINKWMNTMWSIHAVEYYSRFKRKEILTHAAAQMKLEDIVLRGTSQTQADRHM